VRLQYLALTSVPWYEGLGMPLNKSEYCFVIPEVPDDELAAPVQVHTSQLFLTPYPQSPILTSSIDHSLFNHLPPFQDVKIPVIQSRQYLRIKTAMSDAMVEDVLWIRRGSVIQWSGQSWTLLQCHFQGNAISLYYIPSIYSIWHIPFAMLKIVVSPGNSTIIRNGWYSC
jgi:hypothetical protein